MAEPLTPMEILFCDICNESVPQVDLDEKRAILRNGRVVCANCDAAMSRPPQGVGHDDPLPTGTGRRLEPSAGPGPAYQPAAGGGAVVGVMGLLLATLSIVLLCAAAVVGMDRLAHLGEERDAGISALRGELGAAVRSLEADVDAARTATSSQTEFLATRIGGLGDEVKGSVERSSVTVEDLRREVAALKAELARIEHASEQRAAEAGRITAQESAIEALQRDHTVLARSLLDLEQRAIAGTTLTTPDDSKPAWMELVAGLSDADSGIRWEAVDKLGKSGDPGVVPFLIPMLKDADLFVRMCAARVLGELHSERAIPALLDALEDQESPVRDQADVALRAITGRDFKFDPVASESDRERKVKAWRDWYEKSGLQEREPEPAPEGGEESPTAGRA